MKPRSFQHSPSLNVIQENLDLGPSGHYFPTVVENRPFGTRSALARPPRRLPPLITEDEGPEIGETRYVAAGELAVRGGEEGTRDSMNLGIYFCSLLVRGLMRTLSYEQQARVLAELVGEEQTSRVSVPAGLICLKFLRVHRNVIDSGNKYFVESAFVRGQVATFWQRRFFEEISTLGSVELKYLKSIAKEEGSSLDCWQCLVPIESLLRELSLAPGGWVSWTSIGIYKMDRFNSPFVEPMEIFRIVGIALAVPLARWGSLNALSVSILIAASRAPFVAYSKPYIKGVGFILEVGIWSCITAVLLNDLASKVGSGGP